MDIQFDYNSTGAITGANFYPHYNPSDVAGYLFVALFGVATVAHIFALLCWRGKWFLPLILGGLMECFGYYGRTRSHDRTRDFGSWIQQLFLIMVAPPLISATVYTTLSRLVNMLGARSNAWMSPAATTTIFVITDVLALLSQLAGIGLQASTSTSAQETGVTITLAGLYFQLALYVLFLANIVIFDRRNRSKPSMLSGQPAGMHWRGHVLVLYVASIAILIRNIARAAEYTQGKSSPYNQSEAYLYVLDALPMLLSMVAFLIYHPARLRRALRAEQATVAEKPTA